MTLQLLSTDPPIAVFIDLNGQAQLLSTLDAFGNDEAMVCENHCNSELMYNLCRTGQLESAQKVVHFCPDMVLPIGTYLIDQTFRAGHVHIVRWLLTLPYKFDTYYHIDTSAIITISYWLMFCRNQPNNCVWWLMATLPASEFWRLHAKWTDNRCNLARVIAAQTAELAPARSRFMLTVAPELTQRAQSFALRT